MGSIFFNPTHAQDVNTLYKLPGKNQIKFIMMVAEKANRAMIFYYLCGFHIRRITAITLPCTATFSGEV